MCAARRIYPGAIYVPPRRRSGAKYHSRKTTVDGITFDSSKEARRWFELEALQAAGEISDLRRQVKFVLIPTQREPDDVGPRGGVIRGRVLERECAYIADFVYTDRSGATVVEDTKGIRTTEYVIKRKLMLYIHGIRVTEV